MRKLSHADSDVLTHHKKLCLLFIEVWSHIQKYCAGAFASAQLTTIISLLQPLTQSASFVLPPTLIIEPPYLECPKAGAFAPAYIFPQKLLTNNNFYATVIIVKQ